MICSTSLFYSRSAPLHPPPLIKGRWWSRIGAHVRHLCSTLGGAGGAVELDAGRLHCRSMVWVRKAGRRSSLRLQKRTRPFSRAVRAGLLNTLACKVQSILYHSVQICGSVANR